MLRFIDIFDDDEKSIFFFFVNGVYVYTESFTILHKKDNLLLFLYTIEQITNAK